MNFDAQQVIQAELDSSESFRWADQPLQGIQFRRSDLYMIPFSLVWSAFVIYFHFPILKSDPNLFSILLASFFFGVALHFTLVRFFIDALQRRKTYYGLSSKRVIIIKNFFGHRVKSLSLITLIDIELTESSNGNGTIIFGKPISKVSFTFGNSRYGQNQVQPPKFDLIQNAKTVYNQIHDAQKRSHLN